MENTLSAGRRKACVNAKFAEDYAIQLKSVSMRKNKIRYKKTLFHRKDETRFFYAKEKIPRTG
jgi:hypothetical protein